MSHTLKRGRSHPFHIAILRLVVGLVLLTAGGIGVSTYRNTQRAVEQLSHELIEEAAGQTAARAGDLLATAPPALETMRWLLRGDARYGALAEGPPSDEQWRARAALSLQVLQANPGFNKVYYGDRWGDFTAAYRDPNEGVLIDHRWIAGRQTRRGVYRVSPAGMWALVPKPARPYDPRRRPWYVAAVAATGFVWTPPYLFYEPQRPGITAALRLLDPQGRLAGVAAIDFELDPLSRFVQSLQGRRTGKVLILSADGRLIAQPGGIPVTTAPNSDRSDLLQLPLARESADPVLREVALHLPSPSATSHSTGRRPSPDRLAGLEFDSEGAGYLGAFYPFQIGGGQRWTVAVAVPKSAVLSVVNRNSLFTLLVCAGVLLVAVAAGAFLSMQISRPLRAFAEDMRQVEDFVITDTVLPTSAIEEVDVMGRMLGRMKMGLRSFAKYVPSDLVRLLHHSGQEARLGGQMARVTVCVADVVGFTAISEQMSPDALVEALAEYLDEMEAIISSHGGIVDKYEGDAIMALWGAPIRPHREPELQACATALESLDRLRQLRVRREAEGKVVFEAGIAIHTGDAIVGNIGSQRRMNYTAMGDAVNVSHRLEGLTRVYGVRILIGETVFQAAREAFEARLVDRVAVKGRRGEIGIYELLAPRGALDERTRALREEYTEGLRLYQARNWRAARERFLEGLRLAPDDGPSRVLIARCEEYLASPPPAWNGVHVLATK